MGREHLLNDPFFIKKCEELNLKWDEFIIYNDIVVAVKDKENGDLYTVLDENYDDIGITDIYNLYDNVAKMCHKHNSHKMVKTKVKKRITKVN